MHFDRIDDSERDDILDRSTAGFKEWRTRTIDERAAVLRRTADLYEERSDELADHIGREMGKLTRWAKMEISVSVDIYRWYAEHAHELLADEQLSAQGAFHTFVRKEPLGPLLGIMPWNFPFYQVARWAAPNLLLGNSLILKHASICPLSSTACQELLEEAGLPQGAFINLFAASSQMDAFISDPRIKGVSLTGSEGAGAAVAQTAGKNFKKCLLELGGNDPFLVLDDDNLEWVLEQFLKIRMYNTGQACNAPKRLIVQEKFYDQTVAILEEGIANLKVGAYDDPDADIGPLSSLGARDEIVERLEAAASSGDARIVVGGKKIDRAGAFMEPALLVDVDPAADVGCNEVFGPVVIVYSAKDVDQAVEIANNSDYGLSSSVWGSDLQQAQKVAERLNDGMTFVNEHAVTAAGLPFGGVGRSGYGRELGRWGVGEFVNEHLYRVSDQESAVASPAS